MHANKHTSADYQRDVRDFVGREIGNCVSILVSELAQQWEHYFPEYEDKLLNAYRGIPDYEEAARQEGWRETSDGRFYLPDEHQYYLSVNLNERGYVAVSVHRLTEPGQGSNGETEWSFNDLACEAENLDGSENLDITDPDELGNYLRETGILPPSAELTDDEDGNFVVASYDSWEELCLTEDIDADEYAPEIYEHWLVSEWLADRLEEHGNRILRDFFGLTVWCRSTTGQAIYMDQVVRDIYDESHAS